MIVYMYMYMYVWRCYLKFLAFVAMDDDGRSTYTI